MLSPHKISTIKVDQLCPESLQSHIASLAFPRKSPTIILVIFGMNLGTAMQLLNISYFGGSNEEQLICGFGSKSCPRFS